MATQIISTDSIGTGIRVNLGETDSAFITASALVAANSGTGVFGTGSDHTVVVAGDLVSSSRGIVLGDSLTLDARNTVVIQLGGSVTSMFFDAINIRGVGSKLVNYGEIYTDFGFVVVGGSGASLINYGQIVGHSGVNVFRGSDTAVDRARVENFGTITSLSGNAVSMDDRADSVLNHGTINGSVSQSGGSDILTNRGLIVGGVFVGESFDNLVDDNDLLDNKGGRIEGNVGLAIGNDLFDNRGGEVIGTVTLGADNDTLDNRGGLITGTVFGEAGNDIFKLGAGFEQIDGGDGTDVIDFRGTGAVQVSLDGSVDGTGNADEDSYVSIESVFGSAYSDLLVGNGAANTLRGFGGIDTIAGGAGADRIFGDSGIDQLTGGLGNDQFFFERLSDCSDIITDFGNGVGDQDRIMIRASTFGGGLVAGSVAAGQFQARADNVAQDADDRFIFRSTDQTLWFDVDGNGAEGPVMIADLQATATFTVVDIGLI